MNRKEKTRTLRNKFIVIVVLIIFTVFCVAAQGQEVQELDAVQEQKLIEGFEKTQKKSKFFKNLYEDVFKYGTIYIAGNINNPYQKQSILRGRNILPRQFPATFYKVRLRYIAPPLSLGCFLVTQ